MLNKALLVVATMLMTTLSLNAGVVFKVEFEDVTKKSGKNWDDPKYGAAMRSEVEKFLSKELSPLFTNKKSVTVELLFTSHNKTSGSSASCLFPYSYYKLHEENCVDTVCRDKIVDGKDANGKSPDSTIIWRFDPSSYGDNNKDGKVDVGDMISSVPGLLRHEMMHVLGMSSKIENRDNPPKMKKGTFYRFDLFIQDPSGKSVINKDGSLNTAATLADGVSGYKKGKKGNYMFKAVSGKLYPLDYHDTDHVYEASFPSRAKFNSVDLDVLRTLGYEVKGGAGSAGGDYNKAISVLGEHAPDLLRKLAEMDQSDKTKVRLLPKIVSKVLLLVVKSKAGDEAKREAVRAILLPSISLSLNVVRKKHQLTIEGSKVTVSGLAASVKLSYDPLDELVRPVTKVSLRHGTTRASKVVKALGFKKDSSGKVTINAAITWLYKGIKFTSEESVSSF